jgi:hypothetical protein
LIDVFSLKISEFEGVLNGIKLDIDKGIFSENDSPFDIKKRTETVFNVIKDSAEEIRDYMLLFKPEKALTIKKKEFAIKEALEKLMSVLSNKNNNVMLYQENYIEELKKAILEGFSLVGLAKEIRDNPSEIISSIVKLKEVYIAKEYLSSISPKQDIYVKGAKSKKHTEDLIVSINNLERDLGEVQKNLNNVIKEMSKLKSFVSQNRE